MNKLFKIGFMSCLAATTFLTSTCSEDDETNEPTSGKYITKIVLTANNSTLNTRITTYDKEGRILTEELSYKDGKYENDKDISNYTNDKVTISNPNNGNNTIYTIENGRITEGKSVSQNGEIITQQTFTYTSDGYLSSKKVERTYNSNTTTTNYNYIVENGNFVSSDMIIIENNTKRHYTYEYSDKTNKFSVDIAGMLTTGGLNLTGKRSENLPSQTCIENPTAVNQSKSITTYTYTYDGDYLVKIIGEQDGETVSTYEIFYE